MMNNNIFKILEDPSVYGLSPAVSGDSGAAMRRTPEGDMIVVTGSLAAEFECRRPVTLCGMEFEEAPLTAQNAAALRRAFPYCAPSKMLKNAKTVGLGDRLGLASDGHIALLRKHEDVYPVLAQQSMRELSLTSRTYADVLNAATFAVFRQGFRRAWGFDGDHLKNKRDIIDALNTGCTMITLDCGEHIRGKYAKASDEEALAEAKRLCALSDDTVNALSGVVFDVEGEKISYTEADLARFALVYGDMLDFATDIWQSIIALRNTADFEVSIDEIENPTSPAEHFFIASELARRGVRPATVAPRFCGEFQKGIDFIGDPAQFEREMKVHAAIARRFGYKISVHSGSDKFSVFPAIARQTHGVFHVKTAGTNYLEAMRIISAHAPDLYRELHNYALAHFDEATVYYHVTTDLSRIPALETLTDAELPSLFEQNDARQLIHICYGVLLSAKKEDNTPLFRDRLYEFWRGHADEYAKALERHIGKHLELLGC